MKDQIFKYGLFVAGFQIAVTLILYILGPEMMANTWAGISTFVISLGILVYGVIDYRKQNGGFLEFKEAFKLGFLVLMVAAILGVLFNGLLYTVIDPGLPEQLKEIAIENTVRMMEKFGSTEADIDDAVDRIQAQSFTLGAQLTNLLWAVPVNALFAVIIAAFLKLSLIHI